MYDTPMKLARPTRTGVRGADYVETFEPPFTTVWGDVAFHDGTPSVQCAVENDVRIGDFIEVPHD